MKKLCVAVLLGLGILLAVGAQETETETEAKTVDHRFKAESKVYYRNIPLQKVYVYKTGYVLEYKTDLDRIKRLYVPLAWFKEKTDNGDGTSYYKGELVTFGVGNVKPSLTIYYEDGQFKSCRLYVRREGNHDMWGFVPSQYNLDQYFEGVDELVVDYN